MISDPAARAEIAASWNGVVQLRSRVGSSVVGAMMEGALIAGRALEPALNLPFMQAYAVLNDTLSQLGLEGRFVCRSRFLGPLLVASKAGLQWLDYDLIYAGYELRNRVAHHGELATRSDCEMYIDAIGRQLKSWGLRCAV